MGCGKTRLGRDLAIELGLPFFDLDAEIEKSVSRSISRIFLEDGEEGFRELERDMLLDMIGKDRFVLACGGGAPCYLDNMEIMNAHGRTVYLEVPQAILFERLARQRSHRPMIAHLGDRSLQQFISEKLEERIPCYHRAHIHVDPGRISLPNLARLIRGQ